MVIILVFLIVSLEKTSAEKKYTCGVPSKSMNIDGKSHNRIHGGWEARPHSIPWQVRVSIIRVRRLTVLSCGGSLVSSGYSNGSDLVITAAHCIEVNGHGNKFVKAKSIRIIAGAHDLNMKEPSTRWVRVRSVATHESYDTDSLDSDIAILRLETVVPYTDEIRPICLPKHEQPLPYGVLCISSGWGLLGENGKRSNKLQMNTAMILPPTQCPFDHNPKLQICAKGIGNICDGDSGGPLACPINGKYTLIGVASYGDSECIDAVFTNVPYYMDWYEEATKKMAMSKTVAAEKPVKWIDSFADAIHKFA